MSFLWPTNLWLLWLTAALPSLYLWLLRRGKPALRYSDLAAVREAARADWRRHIPPAVLLLACGVLLFATARPTAPLTLPWSRPTIMLAMDVSLSMRVTDVKPTRLAAAQDAAKGFLQDLPKNVEVGLVTFAGSAQVAQGATMDRAALVSAIDGFQMQLGTAIGNAIVLSLAELFPDQGIDLADMTFGPRQKVRTRGDKEKTPATAPPAPVAPGSYDAAAIILLSDGRRTTGVDTLEAAKMAADRGVRIYVVGLGTVDGAAYMEDMAIYMRLDEPTLREIARMTGGEYHYAGTAEDLLSVYQTLGSRMKSQTRETELTGLAALVGALLVLLAVGLSLLWSRRSA